MDANSISEMSRAMGLPQIGDLSFAKIAAYLIFGTIGLVAFMYGKKNSAWRAIVIGIVLMVYPYFVSGTFALYLVGIILSAVLYFWRD